MDRQPHDYGVPMAYGQQQQQQQQAQQYGFHPQHQQFAPSAHGPPFMPPHPSLQQFQFPRPMQQAQLYPHLPPPPHLHQQVPPSYPPQVPPPHLVPAPFHGSAPPAVLPPSDPEVQKRIDKLVEYAIKNGPEFEDVVREREKDNPAYSFLFGGEGHNYYQYKLYISTRPPFVTFNPAFPSSMPLMHPPNAMMTPGVSISAPNAAAVVSPPVIGSSHPQQPPFPPFYERQTLHQAPPLVGHLRPEFDPSSRSLKGLRPLPPDIEVELNGLLNNLTGTKDSIKGAKTWFMQRAPYGVALAEALRDRMFSLDDSERQLHIIYLANDILFDSLQRRVNPHELDNDAHAFRPVLGSMLSVVFNNPKNKEENQSRLQKILQFWASKEVYDQDTILMLDNEMKSAPPTGALPGSVFAAPSISRDHSSTPGMPQLPPNLNSLQWQRGALPKIPDHAEKQVRPMPSFPPQQFLPPTVPPVGFIAPVAPQPSAAQPNPTLAPAPVKVAEKLPPYPLFPPGLIPGMVRKVQIGSGVPYSPISPLDIPAVIPASNVSPSELLDRVSKFFRDIGEVNPSEGPIKASESRDDDDEYGYERASPIRKGGACIPPPPNLNVEPETEALADGSIPGSSTSSRPGLSATADRIETSQYDDVYSSYRKQRSTNYHSSMSARSSGR